MNWLWVVCNFASSPRKKDNLLGAENFFDVTVITDKSDYHKLVEELQKYKGKTSIKFREEMSCKAFASTAFYDATITQWFNEKLKINFPEK